MSLLSRVLIVLLALLCLGACKREAEVRQEADKKKLDMLREENAELFDPSLEIPETPEVFVAWVRTNKGACFVEVNRAWAPNAADQLFRLIRADYYTMQPIYRAIPGRLIQWGIHVRPEINAVWKDHTFEADPAFKSNLAGYVGFAPDPTLEGRLSTQLYINLTDNFELDGQGYVPFGRVLKGLNRMGQIESSVGETVQGGNPRGVDMAEAWSRGIKYLRKNFRNLDMVKSIVLRRKTLDEEEEEEVETPAPADDAAPEENGQPGAGESGEDSKEH